MIRIGIVGCGNIADLNARGYLEHPWCEVTAVCDADISRAFRKADEWHVPRAYRSLNTMLEDDVVDAVEILTPTHLHKEHVLAALVAGKHVSCQKPIANTVADARAMAQLARERGVTFRVTENYLHYGPLQLARTLVREGAVGKPVALRMKTVAGRGDSAFLAGLDPQAQEWRADARSPGGHLFDDGAHKFAVALWLVDSPVRAVQAVVDRSHGYFEPAIALLEYENGLLGVMETAYAPDMLVPSDYYPTDEVFEVQGTEGLVVVTRCSGKLTGLPPVVLYRDGERQKFDCDADWGSSFTAASRHFVDCLLTGFEPDMSGDLATRSLELCFAVYEASDTRARVVL